MNYIKHYNKLIEKSGVLNNVFNAYYEKHHIIPKCIGGLDVDSNIVNMTPEQHYTAHLLLAKIHDIPSLWFAVNLMAGNGTIPSNTRTPNRHNNKSYGFVRRKVRQHMADITKDRWAKKYGFNDYNEQMFVVWDLYYNQRMNRTSIGKKYVMPGGNVDRTIRNYVKLCSLEEELKEVMFYFRSETSKITRSKDTPETRTKRISACQSYDYSENNKKMSEERKGAGNPMYGKRFEQEIISCIHCQKRGGLNAMKRWHFDNCKDKKYENI